MLSTWTTDNDSKDRDGDYEPIEKLEEELNQ